jgi:phosphate-selective porin
MMRNNRHDVQKISKLPAYIACLLFTWTAATFAATANNASEQPLNTLSTPIPEHHFYDNLHIDTTGGGIRISNADGSQTFVVDGQIVLVHSRFGGAYNVDAAGQGHFTQETQLQTMRLGFSGNTTPTWSYAIQIANRANRNNDNNDDAYIRIAKIAYSGWDWGTLSIGRFSPVFGIDNMHDSYNAYGADFAMLSDAFSPSPGIGIALHSTDKYQPWIWDIGFFHIGSTILESRSDLRGDRGYQQESHLYLGRIGRIFYDDKPKKRLLFGQATAYKVNGNDKTVVPISLDGGVLGTLIPSNSPPVTSGPFANSATQGGSYVLDVGISAVNGSFSTEAEYARLHTNYSHIAGDSPIYQGVVLQGAWVLTGESRDFDRHAGYLLGIKPTSPRGAVEVVGRVEHINLTSEAGPEASRNTGNKATTYSTGLIWYVNNHVRFTADLTYLHVTGAFVDKNSGLGGTVQANFFF